MLTTRTTVNLPRHKSAGALPGRRHGPRRISRRGPTAERIPGAIPFGGDFDAVLESLGSAGPTVERVLGTISFGGDDVGTVLKGLGSAGPGWGVELTREVMLQVLEKFFPGSSQVVGDFGVAQAPSPAVIVSSFATALAALTFAGLNGVGDGSANDEWARLAAEEGEEEPDELKVYDPEVAKAYFVRRPATIIKRGWRSSLLLGAWSTALFLDAKLNRRPEDDDKKKNATDSLRASQLRAILIRLGPTYVKLGQVLSSRQDLLPKRYIEELQSLQDSVPPFDDAIARRMVQRELGGDAAARIDYLQPSPVASASLGQVYECLDRDSGRKIALKVQRPGALSAVSLDVAIIRLLGPILYKINDKGGNLDAKALIDEWGSRFVDELDYTMEAKNALEFDQAMRGRTDQLGSKVFAPRVEADLSTRRILTAEWVDGVRIDEARPEEKGRLCALTLSAYLSMLLETGTLHVDPHPGNLLITEDCRVCILDWGLVTTVSKRQQEAILTFISHLVSGDYLALDTDLAVMVSLASNPPSLPLSLSLSLSLAALILMHFSLSLSLFCFTLKTGICAAEQARGVERLWTDESDRNALFGCGSGRRCQGFQGGARVQPI